MKSLIINKIHKAQLPTGWDEISFKKYHELEEWRITDGKDLVKALSILTDVPEGIWDKCNYKMFQTIVIPNILWMSKPPKIRKIRLKDEIKIMGKMVKVPKNIDLETLGQKIAVDQKMTDYILKYKDDVIKLSYWQYSFIMAAYISPKINDKEFDLEYTEIVQGHIQNMPFTEVMPYAAFFFKKYEDFIKKNLRYLKDPFQMKKKKLTFLSLINLGSLRQLMRLQKETL